MTGSYHSRYVNWVHWCGLTTEWSRWGGSHVRQKHAWEKIVVNFYFSWTVNSNKYAVLTTLSSTLLRTKKENCQKVPNLGKVSYNRLRVLSRMGLGWPANSPTCQPQNTVCSYRPSLFRVQWTYNDELYKKTGTATPYARPYDWMKPKFRPLKGAMYVRSVKNKVQ